ncbi:hypothetical protein BHE74_00030380 [Ensete ventricosum]|nr:hypothetical protein BHE74_00030380 [Ensete ventricosum]
MASWVPLSPPRSRCASPCASWAVAPCSWPQPVVPMGDCCPDGWPPPCRWEIIYPCIPDPDGEDEGGQASSYLAVSTRWISAAKLLQSDLTTLAQSEGGE